MSWRWVLATSVVPAAITLVAGIGLPESPRWLMGRAIFTFAPQVFAAFNVTNEAASTILANAIAVIRALVGCSPSIDRGAVPDPSGVVKGWAAERAAAHLSALPDTDFCLSAGGDIICRTLDPASAPWRIGIEDPHDPSRLVAVIPLHTGAVATSGSSRRGAHIVDARTGRPAAGLASVTVVGRSLTAVDIDATAAFALGTDGEAWIATRGHQATLIVRADGSTTLC